MLLSDINIPFSLTDTYNGLAETNGMFRVMDHAILLEFQVKDAVFGVLKSKPKTLRIHFRDLEQIQYKKNWFTSQILIDVKSLTALAGFPQSDQGRVKLNVKRKDKEKILNAVSRINLNLSEYRLEMLDTSRELLE